MAEDTKPDPTPDPKKDDDPDAGAKSALDKERKARRDAERERDEIKKRLDDLESKDKSEVEKLRDENTKLSKERDDAVANLLRHEVAAEKGVKARWLTGTTREELEAAADEYLADHPQAGGGGSRPTPPSKRPSPDLKGGTDPDGLEPVEMDPAKLAEAVPRF